MNKGIYLLVLTAGIVLLVFGASAMNSALSDFSRFVTGTPTNKAMWLLIGGFVATLVGMVGLLPRLR
jgi:uncharacterized protein DUF3185